MLLYTGKLRRFWRLGGRGGLGFLRLSENQVCLIRGEKGSWGEDSPTFLNLLILGWWWAGTDSQKMDMPLESH